MSETRDNDTNVCSKPGQTVTTARSTTGWLKVRITTRPNGHRGRHAMSKTRERKGSVCRMTGADRQTLYEVFGQALDSEEALLAGYYTEIDPDDYRRNRIPASLKADARAAERRIARYKKLREKLLGSTR
jgi:hypothetical protein